MVLAVRNEDYGNRGQFRRPGTNNRGVQSNSTNGRGEQKTDMDECIVQTLEQTALLNVLSLEVVKKFDFSASSLALPLRSSKPTVGTFGFALRGKGSFGNRKPGRHHEPFLFFEALVLLEGLLALVG